MANGTKIRVENNVRRVLKGTPLILGIRVDHTSMTVPGSHQLEYTWTRNGTPFGDQEGDLDYHGQIKSREWWSRPSIILDNIQPGDEGIYQCEIKNHFGNISTTPITVEVFDTDENPLIGKNVINNPSGEEGTLGWTITEGNFQMSENFFWSSFTRKGKFSQSSLTPKINQIANHEVLPQPDKTGNYWGYFIDAGDRGTAKIHQVIELSSISDVIDRNIEGITSVDINLSAWLGSERMHREWNYTYTRANKTTNKAIWKFGTAINNWDQNDLPDGSNLTSPQIEIYWNQNHQLKDDRIFLHYYFLNVKNDVLKHIVLENTPTSYTQNLLAFKQRRVEIPPGTRQLKVELHYKRNGNREWDKDDDMGLQKLIQGATWGISARIYINEMEADKYNPNYLTWQMPPKIKVNPSAINMFYDSQDEIKQWVMDNDPGTYWSETGAPWTKWTGGGSQSSFGYKTATGKILQKFKCFDLGTHYNRHHDVYVSVPVPIKQAARCAHNIKLMNLRWLYDHNKNKMDQYGKEHFHFLFQSPEESLDVASSTSILKKRRTLEITNDYELPSIKQIIRIEDMDAAINQAHKDSTDFRPHSEAAWNFESMEYNMQNGSIETMDSFTYLHNYLYTPFKFVRAFHNGNSLNFEDFLIKPKDSWELEELYNNIIDMYLNGSSADIGTTRPDTSAAHWPFTQTQADTMLDLMKIDLIYHELKWPSGIPGSLFDTQDFFIKFAIRKRLIQTIINAALKAMIGRSAHELDSGWYRNYLDNYPYEENQVNNYDSIEDGVE